jgi:hypothetical protein
MLIIGLPLVYETIKTPQRFDYISVFSDPTIESQIGRLRVRDSLMLNEPGMGLKPSLLDKFFENKIVFVGKIITEHYFQSISSDFLFRQGDPDLRHSLVGMGEMYKIEAIPLILGTIIFFSKSKNKKNKLLIIFWIVTGVLPSSLTRDGGNHATRLILILPPLAFLVAYGIVDGIKTISAVNSKQAKKIISNLLILSYVIGFAFCVIMYLHNYYVHYPWDSERWWHAGWKEAVTYVKSIDKNYDKIVISTANEPPWIYFAAWYEYPPADWQKNFPIGNDVNLEGFGKVSHIDKFYFGSPKIGGVYNFGRAIDKNTLYLADAKEVNVNLIQEPQRTPKDLILLKAIAFPSGEPAFYVFTGRQ